MYCYSYLDRGCCIVTVTLIECDVLLLRNKVTEEKVIGPGTRVVGQLLVDEGKFIYKSCRKEMGNILSSMFINKEGMLVMLCRVQRRGYEWSCETTAQRD